MPAEQSLTRKGSQCAILTLPELLQLSPYSRQLSLSALRLGRAQAGRHLSKFLGRGMDFAESRPYQTGDDIRTLDWKLTARSGKPHTKLFTVEKERQVLLWADMRSSMRFATQGVFKSIQAALMMGAMAWSAVHSGDRLGGLIFNDANHVEFRPALGKKSLLPMLQALSEQASFKKDPIETPRTCLVDQAILNLTRVSSPGSLLFLISDFRGLSSYGQELLLQAAKHSTICLCFIYDPIETLIPKNGRYPLTDERETILANGYDNKSLEAYQRQFIERRKKVRSLSLTPHVHFMECSTTDNCLEILRNHFTPLKKGVIK